MLRVLSFSSVCFLCIVLSLSWECVAQTEETTPVIELSPEASAHKERLVGVCAAENYLFTSPVREAFLSFAKAKAQGELDAQGKILPQEFLDWIDADPEMEAGVYGVRPNASDVLLMLYSLRLDLGQSDFEEYRHLVLASAITHADLASEADLTPREPLELVIGGDPRQPVDTNDPNRELDMNDHIINFLNSTTIESEHDVDLNRILPGLIYDDRGIAIPEPEEVAADSEGPVMHTRTLYAADVLASEALQQKFNDYMRAHGQEIEIHCGEGLVHWKSRNMVRGEEYQNLKSAYLLFRTAYEEKGLLPAERDPIPSPAERCAYLIRNDRYQFPAELQEERQWPLFPLTAPWPLLTMLVQNDQPLREREERWLAFRDDGIFKKYGEYIGSVAQQHDMQSSRRLAPYPFTYGTVQMMLKDGGVCGTMGNISARSHCSLGMPACTAGQPGHCAVVGYRYNAEEGTYTCKGSQYATGGDEKTTPHARWLFQDEYDPGRGRHAQRKAMVYHQSIAWAVNYGMESYLDSIMAYSVYRLLPEETQQDGGIWLLVSGLQANPFNFLLTDKAQETAGAPQEQIQFWNFFQGVLETVDTPGCPSDGLYNSTVKKRVFANIGEQPIPEGEEAVRAVLAFLEAEECDVQSATVPYRVALEGLPVILSATEQEFTVHLDSIGQTASRENDAACTAMAAKIQAVADCIEDRDTKKEWALGLWEKALGREKYFGHRYKVSTDASLPVIARLSGNRMASDAELITPVLEAVASELEASMSGERTLQACKTLSSKITATANAVKDTEQKRDWLESLAEITSGRETFQPSGSDASSEPVRDPCCDTIEQAIAALDAA